MWWASGHKKMPYNQNSGYGRALLDRLNNVAASVCPTFGRIFVVMDPDDTADPNYQILQDVVKHDPEGNIRFFTSLETAYAAATSNNNDVILLDGHSEHVVAAGIDWSKSRIHLVGMDGGDRLVQQGAKVVSTDGVGTAYVIKVTGTRNTFKNVKFIQADTTNTSLTVAQFGGEGTLCKNCSFVFSTAANLDGNETTTYEVVMGEDSGTFINCTFGNDTLDTTGARAVMAIDVVTTSQEMKSCIFKDCLWNILSDDASADFIRVLATTDVKFSNVFINPIFLAGINATTGGVALDDAVRSISGLVEGNLLFVNPATNCSEFCTDVTDNVKVVGFSMADSADADVSATVGIGQVPS